MEEVEIEESRDRGRTSEVDGKEEEARTGQAGRQGEGYVYIGKEV